MLGIALVLALAIVGPASQALPTSLRPTADAWRWSGARAIRGVTIGPIESERHPDRGYGSAANSRSFDEAGSIGATWVSLTPFGRVHDLTPEGIDLSFEAPFQDNRAAVLRSIEDAHAHGLKVMLVPHLWVESGEWRALIDPPTDEGWQRWADAYARFLLAWADVAREGHVELLSVGVELRSFVTTKRVSLFLPIIDRVRATYPGLLTYSANWDDAEDTLIWDAVDLVGINAFYPLAERDGAGLEELRAGGRHVAEGLGRFAAGVRKPIVLTEVGYTTRPNPAIHPWEWPDSMQNVTVDEAAQAEAYDALLGPMIDADWCAGFFVWRYYADPDDVSQEAAWGFSPRGKLAEVVLRDAFTTRFAADGDALPGDLGGRQRARTPWTLGWEASPPLVFEPRR